MQTTTASILPTRTIRATGGSGLRAGDNSIADLAVFLWIRPHGRHGQDLRAFANLSRQLEIIAARPAIAKVPKSDHV